MEHSKRWPEINDFMDLIGKDMWCVEERQIFCGEVTGVRIDKDGAVLIMGEECYEVNIDMTSSNLDDAGLIYSEEFGGGVRHNDIAEDIASILGVEVNDLYLVANYIKDYFGTTNLKRRSEYGDRVKQSEEHQAVERVSVDVPAPERSYQRKNDIRSRSGRDVSFDVDEKPCKCISES